MISDLMRFSTSESAEEYLTKLLKSMWIKGDGLPYVFEHLVAVA